MQIFNAPVERRSPLAGNCSGAEKVFTNAPVERRSPLAGNCSGAEMKGYSQFLIIIDCLWCKTG